MKNLSSLMTMIGIKKTLIIACGEYGLNKLVECDDRIYFYFLPENMLHRHDYLEKGTIQHYIESKECTQVILLGGLEKHMIESFERDEVHNELRSILKFNLSLFLKDRSDEILPSQLRAQLLTEQHIIAQCSMLMDYYFVRNRVEDKQINLIGMITDNKDNFKRIYCNGIIYNDVISLN